MRTQYGIFIIESLRGEDYFDGENLHEILKLSGIRAEYREAESTKDFANSLQEFKDSNFRYLHISCHGDMQGFEINGETIDNNELLRIFRGKLNGRRVFLSSCKGGNRNIATVVSKCRGQSLIGTPIDLYFDKAALFWPSFYHVINCAENEKMNRASISSTLKRCVELFEIPINYYHTSERNQRKLRRYKFRAGERTINNLINLSNIT